MLVRWGLAFAAACGVWLTQFPERFFAPGTFDYLGNSHNLMHFLVLVVYQQLHHGVEELVAGATAGGGA